jgi:4-diphosphocytidyl-2-C-methyl-D-erythritol kinase
VSALLLEKAPAKINLTLRVLGRREDGYHLLESLVAFADLADRLTLEPAAATTLEISGPFAGQCGPIADNLVLKAVTALRQRTGDLKAGHFFLEKNIPAAGGIGGGSADAAAALRLLARVNDMAADDPRLASAAASIGADVPVCLDPRPRIMRGIGDLLSDPYNLPKMPAVLVNPGVPLPTRDVFARFGAIPENERFVATVPHTFGGMIEYLHENGNDLTRAAVACAPVVSEVLIVLRALPAVRFVRMSGSGPTCFALFETPGEAAAAARRLAAEHVDWWVQAAEIGEVDIRP